MHSSPGPKGTRWRRESSSGPQCNRGPREYRLQWLVGCDVRDDGNRTTGRQLQCNLPADAKRDGRCEEDLVDST